MIAQLVATLGGLLAEGIGLRATAWLAPLGGLIGAAILGPRRSRICCAADRRLQARPPSIRWRSPSRRDGPAAGA
jgi:hypothetical protein